MKAAQITEFGGPEVMKYVNVADPTPGEGEAVVQIQAAGVNFTDVYSRQGVNPGPPLPRIIGVEGAGVVQSIGTGVTEVQVGDEVTYCTAPGTYAELAVVPAWRLMKRPTGVDAKSGAAAILQGMTAHFLVFGITRLNPGDQVLVHAGAGGMGLLLIQLLKRLGVHIFTTVSTEAKADMATKAGADQTILYTQQDFEEEIRKATKSQGVKMVLDAVGQTTFEKGFKCLGPRGYMVLYGQAGGAVTDTNTRALQNGSLFLTRPSLGDYTASRDELLQRAQEVLGWVQSGELNLHIGLTLALSEAVEAHRQLEGRETTGKILLTP